MSNLTIKELTAFAHNSPVPFAGGVIQTLGEHETGNEPAPWSLQELTLADETGTITVRIGNHEAIDPSFLESHLPIYFVAAKKPNGALTGLRIQEETGANNKKSKILVVAKSALILGEEEWKKLSGSIQAAQVPAPAAEQHAAAQTPAPTPTQPASNPLPGPHPPAADPPHTAEAPKKAMRITELRYERTVNTGNYCSEKMGITLALEPETKGTDAVKAAKEFLAKHLPPEAIPAGSRPVA